MQLQPVAGSSPQPALASQAARRFDPLWGVVVANTFRIERTIGSGAMGKVYEASHLRIDRRFAIKVIRDTHADSPAAIQRFLREARLLGQIRSPHVVEVIDALTLDDGRPCIVSELLEGEDLQARLNRLRTLESREALQITIDICRGLRAAHQRNAVHRDLKPSNVFLLAQPATQVVAKVVDFGVAKWLRDNDTQITESGAVVGTPAYMPPEQARNPSQADPRSDIYAVGAVLYRMLTGRAPYTGNDPSTTITKLLQQDPPRPRALDHTLSFEIEAIVQRAMARDLAARYQTVDELESDLTALLGHDAAALPTPSRPPAPRTRVKLQASSAEPMLTARRAKYAHPRAVIWLAVALTLLTAASVSLIRGLADMLRGTSTAARGERSMIITMALMATATTAWLGLRQLHSRWRNAPSIEHLGASWRIACANACLCFSATLILPMAYSSATTPVLQWPTTATVAAAVALGFLAALQTLRARLKAI